MTQIIFKFNLLINKDSAMEFELESTVLDIRKLQSVLDKYILPRNLNLWAQQDLNHHGLTHPILLLIDCFN